MTDRLVGNATESDSQGGLRHRHCGQSLRLVETLAIRSPRAARLNQKLAAAACRQQEGAT
jgi:hypothetical protein